MAGGASRKCHFCHRVPKRSHYKEIPIPGDSGAVSSSHILAQDQSSGSGLSYISCHLHPIDQWSQELPLCHTIIHIKGWPHSTLTPQSHSLQANGDGHLSMPLAAENPRTAPSSFSVNSPSHTNTKENPETLISLLIPGPKAHEYQINRKQSPEIGPHIYRGTAKTSWKMELKDKIMSV